MFSIEPFCWHYPGCCYCTIVVVIVFIKLLLLLLWRSTQLNNIYNNNNKWMTNNWQAHPSTHQWGEPYKTTIITTKMKNNKRCKIVWTTITKRINKWQGLKTTKQAKNTYVHTTKIYHYLYVYVCLGQHIAECRHISGTYAQEIIYADIWYGSTDCDVSEASANSNWRFQWKIFFQIFLQNFFFKISQYATIIER